VDEQALAAVPVADAPRRSERSRKKPERFIEVYG
jgi:hypothetical protein